MALPPGTRVGPYEVTGFVGAGGMGEVYRARDHRLERDVAIKILPASVSGDPERVRRFEQEARAVAAISHPNILVVHDVGQCAPLGMFVAFELLEGQTLADRLHEGPPPVRRAIEWTVQMTRGLAAAHAKGVVHRDLKPANVFVTLDNHVKLLDFGLARLTEPGSGPEHPDTRTATWGLVVGTPGYMSPEQARGTTIDHRTDIFAIGAMLYEMLAGRRAFPGASGVEAMHAVLTTEPAPLTTDTIPAALSSITARCLEKNPGSRFQSAADLAYSLEAFGGESALKTPAVAAGTSRQRSPWVAAAAMLAVGAIGVASFMRAPTPLASNVVFSAILPPSSLADSDSTRFAMSPDGTRLAIVARTPAGRSALWIRPLDSPEAQALAGTEDAEAPFWSPDSRSVAFVAGGRLKRIDAGGGPIFTIAEPAIETQGAWGRDDVILFTARRSGALSRVSASGGTVTAATSLDDSVAESIHASPFFLPDGRHFLYSASSSTGPLSVNVGTLDSQERTRLLQGALNAQYAQGTLLYVQDSTLLARPFDAVSRTFTGNPVPIASPISTGRLGDVVGAFASTGAFSVSERGALVYQTVSPISSRLVWMDRAGRQIGSLGESAVYGDLVLSHDGRKLSVSVAEQGAGSRDIWVFDVGSGAASRATLESGSETDGILSPDGSRLVYNANASGRYDLFEKDVAAADSAVLLVDEYSKIPLGWSPDGASILFLTMPGPSSSIDLWTVGRDRVARPFLHTPFSEGFAATFSPDGRWVAYGSLETGRSEVYVAPFPADITRKHRVSRGGGATPRWGRDGRELFYFEAASGQMMVVPLEYSGNDARPGTASTLFKATPVPVWALWYDVTRDGQRFLVNTPTQSDPAEPITLVTGWTCLGRAAPAGCR